MNREQITNSDFAVMRLGSPENLMIITVLMTLETPLEAGQLETVLKHSLLHHSRFRQRIVMPRSPLLKPYWIEDKYFNLRQHIQCIRTPLPADSTLLEELVGRLMSVDLDYSRPLWQFYLVEQYGNGSALILRLHHSIADGVSLVKILLSMFQDKPGDPVIDPPRSNPEQVNARKLNGNGKEPNTMQILSKLAGAGKLVLNDANAFEDAVRIGGSAASAIGQLLFSIPDKGTQFRGAIGIKKRATWSPALSLEQIKFVSKVFDCTINDVLLSAVAGALRRYMLPSDPDFASVEMHTIVPVDMRRDSRVAQVQTLIGDIVDEPIGNRVGAALLSLPIDIADPVDRLAVIHQTMVTLKASGEGLLTYWMMSALGAVPGDIQNLATDFWLTKSSAVMTNVVGPNRQLYLGNAAIDTWIGWVPQFGPVGLGVSIFSYNGKVWLGVATDQGLAPDPEKIVGYFLDELRSLGMQAVQLKRPK